jgi:hypothetical protein
LRRPDALSEFASPQNRNGEIIVANVTFITFRTRCGTLN